MTYTVYQEFTDWAGLNISNHKYIFDKYDRCVGYIPKKSGEAVFFNKPSVAFSKSRRKFKKLYTMEHESV